LEWINSSDVTTAGATIALSQWSPFMTLSSHARIIIGIMLITFPAVEYGGYTLLRRLKGQSGYIEWKQGPYFRAGHAHAGVLLIVAIVAQILIDTTHFTDPFAYILRVGFMLPPILMPIGYFAGAPDDSGNPKPILRLVYVGAISLAISTLVLGIGLVLGL
jgi:hypothetical protein